MTFPSEGESAEVTNISRDGKFLVVPVRCPNFPMRCIKTGKPLSEKVFNLTLDVVLQHEVNSAATIVGQAIGGTYGKGAVKLAAAFANKVKFSCQIGLCEELMNRCKRLRRIAFAMIFGAPIILTIFFTISFALRIKLRVRIPDAVEMTILLLGTGACLAGLILRVVADSQLLTHHKNDGVRIWMAGACPDFLLLLPEYRSDHSVDDENARL